MAIFFFISVLEVRGPSRHRLLVGGPLGRLDSPSRPSGAQAASKTPDASHTPAAAAAEILSPTDEPTDQPTDKVFLGVG